MPRKGRGQRYQQPPSAAPASSAVQDYGEKASQLRGQEAVPIANEPRPAEAMQTRPGPKPQGGAPAGGSPGPSPVDMLRQVGAGTPLNAPSNRPDEPVTAGLASGPGPGPEVLPDQQARVRSKAAEGFEAMGIATGDQAMLRMADMARRLAEVRVDGRRQR